MVRLLAAGMVGAWLGSMGCSAQTDPATFPEGMSQPEVGASTGELGDSDGSDGRDGSDGSDGMPEEKLDLPAEDDTLGCRKIDFLFVIDDSESMADEQQRLIDGFPGFMRGVQDTIAEFDHHVMVVTTGSQEMSFDPCENELGTGRVRGSEAQDCGLLTDFLNGQRYVDPSHGDVEAAFSCIADVGTDGDGDEKTVWALAEAITTQNAPGMCNEGFLRDDAILVVTIITDEEDSPEDGPPGSDNDDNSPGDPALWRDGLVQAKHGDEEAVVVLALVGDSDLPDAQCDPYVHPDGLGAEPAVRIRDLTESLAYGSWASVCQDDYTEFFTAAIADIDSACAGFNPG